jgi:hypothetical protein
LPSDADGTLKQLADSARDVDFNAARYRENLFVGGMATFFGVGTVGAIGAREKLLNTAEARNALRGSIDRQIASQEISEEARVARIIENNISRDEEFDFRPRDANGRVVNPNELRYVAPDTYESPQGLRYGPDSLYGNRVQHVLRHTEDQPLRPEHGVFDASRSQVIGQVDEVWIKAQRGGLDVAKQTAGNVDEYTVNMGFRVGWIGGTKGAALGNPATTYVRLVVRNGNEVITAYPVRP